MDNAYLYGHDYDSYRSREMRSYEETFSVLSEQSVFPDTGCMPGFHRGGDPCYRAACI